uniref:AT rich interactive domain 4A (RBP1-like) n=1 Tax=Astyanax mexicanus TaxID=7994 RepID=A0A8B9KZB2_ASTMX
MRVADEPAYLTVGTDVSAKYRGAFCEAKIKTVKRMVKVKVVLKADSSSQIVQDDQVKGPLRVGSTVEVKSPEGASSEAVISKLTDASWYTVVFDDGDEKTLRRTSLCLKGERHFAESETLDQLPLTNPEHFGTPVIGKKTNRGRRSSQAVAEEEKESSSSEEEDEDRRRLNDDLLGKVVVVQSGSDKASWYHALVVSPSCNDDITVKKDQCLARSFFDSKFYTVARSDVREMSADTISKSEFSNKKGFEEALKFLQTTQIPEGWKMDMSEILESSSSDDGEGKESEEEEKDPEPEEPDDEPDPEERDHFLQQLYKFMEDRGTPINKPPVLGYKDLNLFKLFRLVYHHGGCDNIESGSIWKQVYMDLGIPVLNSAASYNVKTAYKKYLYGFEEYCRSAKIQFRTVHHNEPRPVTEPEMSVGSEKEEECEEKVDQTPKTKAEPEQDKDKADGDESDADEEKIHKEICSPRVSNCCGSKNEQKGEEKEKPEAENPVKRRSRRHEESDKDSEEEDQDDDEEDDEEEEDDVERSREDREDEDGCEESEHSITGTKVRVKYGKGKTQKIYEANIKSTETDDGEVLYLVHYYGWNVRYDEWVKADRIIWPVDKGGTKKKQKKKVKVPCTLVRQAKKPQETVYSSPVERMPEKADSDTDSATEDVSPPESTCIAKRKATEQRTPDKKVRLERKEEPKTLSQPKTLSPEKRIDTDKSAAIIVEAPTEEPEVKSEMPSLTREVQVRMEPLSGLCTLEDPSGVTDEELMPQIGPEALVCHEVDLDDPEEKDKPSGEELLVRREEKAASVLSPVSHLPHSLAGAPQLCSPSSTPSPDESHSIKSESDATIEVDSVAESQEGIGENGSPHGFDASASSSNSSISLQERDSKDRGQKRLLDCNMISPPKKLKRNQKRLSAASTAEKNGAGHSSDSEDLPAMDTSNKLTPVKHSSLAKAQKHSRSPGLVSPSSKEMEKDKHKDKHGFHAARAYKWTFQLNELDNMSSAERIAFLQDKLQEIRKYYMSLKSEVASIDRRRKRLKKKEREGNMRDFRI